jgi:hypothetical protein
MNGQLAPTVFTHFYCFLHRRDHHSWPISGFEDTKDEHANDPNIYWWKQELEYVARARIDVLNLMFWAPNGVGADGSLPPWHKFLQVASERRVNGFSVPGVACFYDGMGFGDLKGIDCGSAPGIEAVFKHMAEFFDFWTQEGRREHLFTHEGADVVFMYRPEPPGEVKCPAGGKFVAELRRRFAERYPGRRLFLVMDMLWTWTYNTNELHATNADHYFFWGSSMKGPTIPGGKKFPAECERSWGICSIGPGFYDVGHDQQNMGDPAVGHRSRDWRGGKTFREDFETAIRWRGRAPWLILETWNLFLERSEITANNKVGDLFVEISREMVPRFKAPA